MRATLIALLGLILVDNLFATTQMSHVRSVRAEPYGNDDDYDDEPESSGAAAAPLATFASGSDVNNSDDDDDDDDEEADEPVAAAPSTDYPDESYTDDAADGK